MKYIFNIFVIILLTLQLKSQSDGGITSGATDFCGVSDPGFITLTGHTGTILFWESSIDNGLNWSTISNPTSSQSYSNINQTTWFRAIVKNGSFPQDTSTISIITIHPLAVGGNIMGGGSFCLSAPSGTLNLSNNVGQVSYWEYSIDLGNTWSVISNTLTSLSYSTITQNTLYRAIVKNILTCPTDTSSVASIQIYQNTVAGFLSSSDTLCFGANRDTLRLTGQTGNVINWIKSLDNGVTWQNINDTSKSYIYNNITQSTIYAIVVKNGSCLTDTSTTVNLVVVNAQIANAGADKTIIQYESIQLEGSGYGTPEWSPNYELNNPNIFNPIASPLHTTTYVLTLTDQHSCLSTDSVKIQVIIPNPNAITPNGDGINDYFLIENIEEYSFNTFTVVNRWGTVVFKESPYKNNWNGISKNGQELPDDIYYYIFDNGTGEVPTTGYILIKR